MQPLCQISKSKPCNNLSTALRDPTSQKDIRHIVQSTEVRNNIINIHLPLMIFIRIHSQESQFHNKCLIFLKMSIIYFQIATFVSAFGKQIKTHEALSLVADEMSKVPLQSVETCQTMNRIHLKDVFNITSFSSEKQME
jgi:hypothetical protein